MPHTIPSYLNPKDPEKSFYTMAQQRIAIYEQVADLIIPTEDLDIQQILLLCKKQAEYCPGKRI